MAISNMKSGCWLLQPPGNSKNFDFYFDISNQDNFVVKRSAEVIMSIPWNTVVGSPAYTQSRPDIVYLVEGVGRVEVTPDQLQYAKKEREQLSVRLSLDLRDIRDDLPYYRIVRFV